MKTTRMMIDVDNWKIRVKVQDEEVSFNLFELVKHSKDKGICFQIDSTEEAIREVEKQPHNPSPLEQALTETYIMIGKKEEQEVRDRLKNMNTPMNIPSN